jgi:hypothetical protein
MEESDGQGLARCGRGPFEVAHVLALAFPELVAAARPKARPGTSWSSSFGAEIRNPRTRLAYAVAAAQSTSRCEREGPHTREERALSRGRIVSNRGACPASEPLVAINEECI